MHLIILSVSDIRAVRCEIDIKKFAYASAEDGGARCTHP